MDTLIGFLFIAAIVAIIVVVSVINNKNMKIVKEKSKLFRTINVLNEKFKFHKISGTVLRFNPTFKSKRSLENLDMYKYAMEQILNNQAYYTSLFRKVDENISNYREYLNQYNEIKRFTSEEEFFKFEGLKIKYKTFVKCEEKLYNSLKQKQPISDITFKCHATYTSPSGKNHYWRDSSYNYGHLKRMLRDIEEQQEIKIAERQRKEQLAEEKRAKEKRLRELDKLETRLAQKEKEINEKEKEFLEATKEHIYTAEKIEVNTNEIEIDENLSLSQKLKLLKEKYDNGEITYEEYQAKRKEIM